MKKLALVLTLMSSAISTSQAEVVGPGYEDRPRNVSKSVWHMECHGAALPFIVTSNGDEEYVDVTGPGKTRRYHWDSMKNLNHGFIVTATDPTIDRTMTFRFGSLDGSWVLPESNSDGSIPHKIYCNEPY